MQEMVKEIIQEKRKVLKKFFGEYGKLAIVLGLLSVILASLLGVGRGIASSSLKVSFLDIGQGDAILVQTPGGHDMLIDGGPSDRILEKLSQEMSYFDRHLDVVVSTHPDADHITGLIVVLQKYDVDRIIISPSKGHTGVFEVLQKSIDEELLSRSEDSTLHKSIHVGKAGDTITFGDGVVARIIYPAKNFHGNKKYTNDASVSMVITYGNESVLLTGDLPSTYERSLISAQLPRNVTIYKAGHHGSKYSSGDVLLSYIRPEYAVISAGKDNTYGHPNPETIGRLKVYSQEILSTIDRGTITFLLDGKGVELETEK